MQNIIKLAVGIDSVAHLYERQATRLFDHEGRTATVAWTRRKPRAEAEVVAGGSIYWVIRNHILVRQNIWAFTPYEDEKDPSWVLVLDPNLVQTMAVHRKAFQGWRYLMPDQAPPDRGRFVYGEREQNGSPEMEAALQGLGLL
jgi:hypothetical protein